MNTGLVRRSRIADRLKRSAAVITVGTMLFSCIFFYFDDDINYAVTGMAAPALTKLVYKQTKSGKYQAVLNWKAKKGYVYQVIRKKSKKAKYRVIAKVKASSSRGKFTDKQIGKNKTYTYSVRRIKTRGSKVIQTGKYDVAGLTTLKTPTLKVDFTNLKGDLSWKKVSGATKYYVYRRVGKSSKFYKIKSLSYKTRKYTDYWYRAARVNKTYNTKLAAIINHRLRGVFLDASNNPVSFRVQAYSSKRVNFVKKESYGLYLWDGEFRLEAPTIVSLSEDGVIKWGHVANAEGYRLYSSPDGKSWKKITDVKTIGGDYIPAEKVKLEHVYQEYQLKQFDPDLYYTVRAYAKKNGKRLYGAYDKQFTIKNRGASEKVLYVGDSISFGSPYYEREIKNFSYQNRIAQLTGVTNFNPSIPGATYHFGAKDSATMEEESDTSTSKLVTGIVQMMVKGPGNHTDKRVNTQVGPNTNSLTDFDVVVLAGGTNDYLHYDKDSIGTNAGKLIGLRETDWENETVKASRTTGLTFTNNKGTFYETKYTGEDYDYNIKTFDGAYNQIMKWIEAASIYRVQHGQKPIQVVAMSIFYSDRAKAPYGTPTNRDTTKNSIGLTLKDYQTELNYLNSQWKKSAAMKVWEYDTRSVGILNSKTCPYATADNLHLTKYSYARYGNSISNYMMTNFLGKEDDANVDSEEFIALAAKHNMLRERLLYLEELAGMNTDVQEDDPEDDPDQQLTLDQDEEDDAEPDPVIEEMKDYIRLLYRYRYLDRMLEECTEEERARFEKFIEDNDLLPSDEETEPDTQEQNDEEEDPEEEPQDGAPAGEQGKDLVSGDEQGNEQPQDNESMDSGMNRDDEQQDVDLPGSDEDDGYGN